MHIMAVARMVVTFSLALLVVQCAAKQEIDESCFNDNNCGDDAFCLGGICTCELGSLVNANRVDCDEIKCRSSDQCLEHFPNTIYSKKKCTCDSSYRLNKHTQKCEEQYQVIGGQCLSSDECAPDGTVCAGLICKCRMGYRVHDNKMDCVKKMCWSDYDCAEFGNAQCQRGQCQCKPQNEVDPILQKCQGKQTTVPVGGSCLFGTDCGRNANCFNSKCRCPMGYRPDKNGLDCAKVRCSSNFDCGQFVWSECVNGECICQPGFAIDKNTQKCTSDELPLSMLAIVIIVIIISLVAIVLAVVCIATSCYCCCCRRPTRPQQIILSDQTLQPNFAYVPSAPVVNSNQLYPNLSQAPPPYNPDFHESNAAVQLNYQTTNK